MTILTGDQTIDSVVLDAPLYLDGGHITLTDVVAPHGVYISRPASFKATGCRFYRDSVVPSVYGAKDTQYGLRFTGGKDITVEHCEFTNLSMGIEVSPGHPWSFKDEAGKRGIGGWWAEGNQFQGGSNIAGCIATPNGSALTVVGNGTQHVKLKISKDDASPIHRLDRLSLTGNAWYCAELPHIECLWDDGETVTLWAPLWEQGKVYTLFTVNHAAEVVGIRIEDNRFTGCKIAGTSIYHAWDVRYVGNSHSGGVSDYAAGFEQCRKVWCGGNIDLDKRSNGGFGLVGYAEDVRFESNRGVVRGQANNRPWINVTGVDEVLQVSPWYH